jgi:hypothetical protein
MASIRAFPTYYSPLGFQKLTVSSSPVGFTLPTVSKTNPIRAVIFTCENNDIRMKIDGGAASATDGLLVKANDIVEILNVEAILNCSLMAVAADAIIQIEYFGGGM